ncbi:sulfotransferase [Kitasatospora sp. NPDC048194]|uniref:sulfotransferase family protein n=1 Tax=Kitasatospora sp. NPDC048194 TaxID=3364045 RepID=UPI00371B3155
MNRTTGAAARVLDNDPVFVAGYPRSGTTLLYRMLAQHAEFGAAERTREMGDSAHETALSFYMSPRLDFGRIAAQGWPHWTESLGGSDGLGAFLARRGPLGPVRDALESVLTRTVFGDEVFERFTDDVDSVVVRGWSRADRRLGLRRAAMRISRRRDVVRDFFALTARAGGAERILDKFPFHYYRFAELSVALPNSRFVFVHRDPVDVFASMLRRARVELGGRPPVGSVAWLVMSAAAFVQDWCDSARAALAFARTAPDRLLVVDYELLTSPELRERQSVRLADFLGLDPAVWAAARPGSEETPDTSKRFPLRSAVPVPNARRYAAELADSDVATVQRGCRTALTALRRASE